MKKKLIIFVLGLGLAGARADYTVTNDLAVDFNVSCWTNAGATNLTLLSSNVAPGGRVVFAADTNGAAGISVKATNAWLGVLVPWTNAPFATGAVSRLLTTALQLNAPRNVYVPQHQTVLKSYFTTGARPSSADYWELIDTFFWYVNLCYSNTLPWTVHSSDTLPFFGDVYPRTNVTHIPLAIATSYISNLTARAGGGYQPYTYDWTWQMIDSSNLVITSNTIGFTAAASASTHFKMQMYPINIPASANFVLTCTLTDASNAVTAWNCQAKFRYP